MVTDCGGLVSWLDNSDVLSFGQARAVWSHAGRTNPEFRYNLDMLVRLKSECTMKTPLAVLVLLVMCLTVACSQSPVPDSLTSTPSAVPELPTVTPEPTPVPPPPTPEPTTPPVPTVTATPAPTPRVIKSRAQTESKAAPDFEIETFDGDMLRLSELEGQVVVLNFWASWCPPCRWEMPFFETMWNEYRDKDVVFVGVAMSDTLEDAQGFAEEAGVTYPVGLDQTNEIVRAYEVRSLPTTFFIGKDGQINRRLTSAANEALLKVFLRGQLPRE